MCVLLIQLHLTLFFFFPFIFISWEDWEDALNLTLYNFMSCSLLGSFVLEILQARILKWIAISFSRL